MIEFLFGLLLFVFIVVIIVLWFQGGDNTSWREGQKPDPNAVIVDFTVERVKDLSNEYRYKTTVEFSDGYKFVTHSTKRENHLLTYSISVDREVIRAQAIEAHDKAVRKWNK